MLIVSGDIWTRFDYGSLAPAIDRMSTQATGPRAHLVMVPNPPYHAGGDFALDGDRVELAGGPRLTFGNIGVYDSALFRGLTRGVKLRMLPLYHAWISERIVCGERYDGPWANVGTPADLAALDASLTPGSAHDQQARNDPPHCSRHLTPMNDNPLLDFSGLPRFDDISAAHIVPAIDALLADARAVVERDRAATRRPRHGTTSSRRPRRRSTTSTARGAPCAI